MRNLLVLQRIDSEKEDEVQSRFRKWLSSIRGGKLRDQLILEERLLRLRDVTVCRQPSDTETSLSVKLRLMDDTNVETSTPTEESFLRRIYLSVRVKPTEANVLVGLSGKIVAVHLFRLGDLYRREELTHWVDQLLWENDQLRTQVLELQTLILSTNQRRPEIPYSPSLDQWQEGSSAIGERR